MLPIVITGEPLKKIAAEAEAGREIEINLPGQTVTDAQGNELAKFEVESFRKHCLVNGFDDIGLTMQSNDKIVEFERRRTQDYPWLDGTGYMKRRGGNAGPVKVEAAPVPKTNRGDVKDEPLEW